MGRGKLYWASEGSQIRRSPRPCPGSEITTGHGVRPCEQANSFAQPRLAPAITVCVSTGDKRVTGTILGCTVDRVEGVYPGIGRESIPSTYRYLVKNKRIITQTYLVYIPKVLKVTYLKYRHTRTGIYQYSYVYEAVSLRISVALVQLHWAQWTLPAVPLGNGSGLHPMCIPPRTDTISLHSMRQ